MFENPSKQQINIRESPIANPSGERLNTELNMGFEPNPTGERLYRPDLNASYEVNTTGERLYRPDLDSHPDEKILRNRK